MSINNDDAAEIIERLSRLSGFDDMISIDSAVLAVASQCEYAADVLTGRWEYLRRVKEIE